MVDIKKLDVSVYYSDFHGICTCWQQPNSSQTKPIYRIFFHIGLVGRIFFAYHSQSPPCSRHVFHNGYSPARRRMRQRTATPRGAWTHEHARARARVRQDTEVSDQQSGSRASASVCRRLAVLPFYKVMSYVLSLVEIVLRISLFTNE